MAAVERRRDRMCRALDLDPHRTEHAQGALMATGAVGVNSAEGLEVSETTAGLIVVAKGMIFAITDHAALSPNPSSGRRWSATTKGRCRCCCSKAKIPKRGMRVGLR
jgi:hypothetical protein